MFFGAQAANAAIRMVAVAAINRDLNLVSPRPAHENSICVSDWGKPGNSPVLVTLNTPRARPWCGGRNTHGLRAAPQTPATSSRRSQRQFWRPIPPVAPQVTPSKSTIASIRAEDEGVGK
jgi:hypothetical protein